MSHNIEEDPNFYCSDWDALAELVSAPSSTEPPVVGKTYSLRIDGRLLSVEVKKILPDGEFLCQVLGPLLFLTAEEFQRAGEISNVLFGGGPNSNNQPGA